MPTFSKKRIDQLQKHLYQGLTRFKKNIFLLAKLPQKMCAILFAHISGKV
jgi:hypothetical protein